MRFTHSIVALGAALLAALVLSAPSLAKGPSGPSDPGAVPNAVLSATNGILTVSIDDTSGRWTVTTGVNHPRPNATVLFPIGTSYITLRDATASDMWTNGGPSSAGLAGYTLRSMTAAPATQVTTALGANGFRTVYTLPNWIVTQDVVINGTTLANTNVLHNVTVQNTSGAARQYGVRIMWDWEINGNDASVFRTRNPDSTFTSTFATYNNPSFQLYEEVDNPVTPAFSVFGTVGGTLLTPPPTQPEQLRYSSWGAAVSAAWDFVNSGAGSDSATEYYWGFATPLTAAAGASVSYAQYLTTIQSAVGIPVTPLGPVLVPTMSEWGMLVLMALVAALAMWTLRRRRF